MVARCLLFVVCCLLCGVCRLLLVVRCSLVCFRLLCGCNLLVALLLAVVC